MVGALWGPAGSPAIFPECWRLCCSALLGSLCERSLFLSEAETHLGGECDEDTCLRISNGGPTAREGWGQVDPGLAEEAKLTLTLNSV